jgi:hypothetical protein
MVTVTVDISEKLTDLGGLSKEMIREGMKKTSQDLIRNLQIRSPVDHGLLKQWAVTSQTDTEIEIRSPAKYAGYVNYGHSQQPGRFIPGTWQGDKFRYNPKAKTGMVLKKSHVSGKHFVEASIRATQPRIKEFFTIKG